MYKLLKEKGLVKKSYWKDIEEEVVIIKCLGNYNQFIDTKYYEGTFVRRSTTEDVVMTHKEYFKDLLLEGMGVYKNGFLIYKEGFEGNYISYLNNYIKGLNNLDLLILDEIKDKGSLPRVRTYLTLFREGTLSEDTFKQLVSNNLKSIDSIDKIMNINSNNLVA